MLQLHTYSGSVRSTAQLCDPALIPSTVEQLNTLMGIYGGRDGRDTMLLFGMTRNCYVLEEAFSWLLQTPAGFHYLIGAYCFPLGQTLTFECCETVSCKRLYERARIRTFLLVSYQMVPLLWTGCRCDLLSFLKQNLQIMLHQSHICEVPPLFSIFVVLIPEPTLVKAHWLQVQSKMLPAN